MLLLIFTLTTALIVWSYQTYPRIGHLLYDADIALEARLYRLRKVLVPIGEMPLSTYQGGPRDATATLVLLHGYSADKSNWLRFARHFSGHYRVIIPDLAGHGESGFRADLDYGIPAQGQRLIRLLDACAVGRVHLVGNSMGGFIAAWLAASCPERVLSLALFDPAGVIAPVPSDMERMLAHGKNPFLVESREDFRQFYAMTMASPPWIPESVLDAMAERYQQRRGELAKIFQDLRQSPTLEPRLGEIQAPTLLLWGREDRLIHASSALVWAKGIARSEVTIWQGIGHMPMVERPSRTARLYRQFLARHPR